MNITVFPSNQAQKAVKSARHKDKSTQNFDTSRPSSNLILEIERLTNELTYERSENQNR